MTYDRVAAKKDKAERFVRYALDDPDRADEIANESVESYADRKRLVINPGRTSTNMANASQSKQDLLDQIADLQDDNDALQAQLDAIQDVLSGSDDDGDPDSDSDLDEDDDGQD
jgi:hypothetical protein